MEKLICRKTGQLMTRLVVPCAAFLFGIAYCPGLHGEPAPASAPKSGDIITICDSEGNPIGENLVWLKQALSTGQCKELRLTIRNPIQKIAEEELDVLVEKYNPRQAFAIMADPSTGDIMALAMKNGSKPDDVEKDADTLPSNFIYDPGSLVKPMTISAALDLGLISSESEFDCENGAWDYAGETLKDAAPYGVITVCEIMKVSSNIGTAKIALKVGNDKLYDAFRSFGFGQKTGLPFSSEQSGVFRAPKDWEKFFNTRFPIGAGISVTPFQIVRAYCAFANGGKLVKLNLVDGGKDPQTGKIVRTPAEPGEKIFKKDDTCGKIVSLLKLATTEGGTGINAAIPGYEVAGTTGTSQKWVDGDYSETKFIASFIGFVPADNPKFVLIVVADEPEGSRFGGIVAAPAFKNISEKTLKLLGVEPVKPVAATKGKED